MLFHQRKEAGLRQCKLVCTHCCRLDAGDTGGTGYEGDTGDAGDAGDASDL